MNDFVEQTFTLPEEARAKQYKEVRTTHKLVERARAQQGKMGLIVFGIGTIALMAAVFVAQETAQELQKFKPVVIEVNHSTGYVGPAHGVDDVPRMLDERHIRGEIVKYILARERYIPQIDALNWTQVRAMSDTTIFNVYNTWSNSREAPKKHLGTSASLDVKLPLHFGEPIKSENGTTTYDVKFDRAEIVNGAAMAPEICTTRISVQFDPKILLLNLETQLNSMGMQVVAYDKPDCKFVEAK